MGTSWIKDLGEVLIDETHIILTKKQYESLDKYNNILQPTSPSVGRCFRTGDNCFQCRENNNPTNHPHLVVFVEPDPDDPQYVFRHGRLPLFCE